MEDLFQMKLTEAQVNEIPNLSLALVGDGVYELMCRTHLCAGGDRKLLNLHRDTVEMVKAPAQARFADKLLPHLTEAEQAEQAELRREYIEAYKASLRAQLDNTYVVTPDGKKKKLKKRL